MSVRFCAAARGHGGMLWIAVVAVVLFAGLFLQITMLSRISSVSKQTAAVQAQTSALVREEVNLELRVNEFHNLEQIAARAQQLGMEPPDEAQIRAICVE